MPGVQRIKNQWIGRDLLQRRDRDCDEPHEHHRPEKRRDLGGAARLHGEQRDKDHDRERHNVRLEGRRRDLETFHGRQHRQRGRDHRVAIEQRTADRAEQKQHRRRTPERALGQRHQGERAALPVVVGAQQDQHVLERDDDDQRPRSRQRSLRGRHRVGWYRCRRRRRRCCRL